MEFKKLSDVEVVAEPSESANVLIEENGVIKKVHKDEVGGGSKKELIYEWNFSADDEVFEIIENVNEDISWLAYKTENADFEIEYITYQTYCDVEDNIGMYPDGEQKNIINSTNIPYESSFYSVGDFDFQHFKAEVYGITPWLPDTILQDGDFRPNHWSCYFVNHYHCDPTNYELTKVDLGGTISFEEEYNPIKTIRIYKITH